MFTDPTTPNLADFNAYALAQGVPTTSIPSGSLSGLVIETSGAATGTTSGSVQAGQVLVGTDVPAGSYVTAWSGTSGTVAPPPIVQVSASSAQTYSQYVAWALNYALQVALPGPGIGGGLAGFAGQYVIAVYNLGMHQLLKIGQDGTNQTFFAQIRTQFKLTSLVPGPVLASGDQATSETLLLPDFFKGLTLSQLDLLKTPYGRDYLGYAQDYGPTIVGVS